MRCPPDKAMPLQLAPTAEELGFPAVLRTDEVRVLIQSRLHLCCRESFVTLDVRIVGSQELVFAV
jgi:hypothetical protein